MSQVNVHEAKTHLSRLLDESVASATDSESCGTWTSTMDIDLYSLLVLGTAAYLVRTKPLSLPNAASTSAFC